MTQGTISSTPPSSAATEAPAPTAAPPSVLDVIDALDIVRREYPQSPDIIKGILPAKSRAIISGPAKLGKTRYGLGLAIGVATGTNVMGFEITKPHRVLYFQAEVSEVNLQRRLKIMLDGLRADEHRLQENLLFCSERLKLNDPENCSAIRKTLLQRQPEILMFDPLYKYNNGDESTVAGMTRFFDPLDEWIDEFGLSVMLVHHHGKFRGGYLTPAHLNRGSSTIADWADSLLTLTHEDPAAGIARLDFTLRNAEEPEPRAYYRNPQTLWFEPLAGYDFAVNKKRRGAPRKVMPEDVVELVETNGENASYFKIVETIVAAFAVSQRTAKNVIAEALKLELLSQDEAGLYHAPGGAEIMSM